MTIALQHQTSLAELKAAELKAGEFKAAELRVRVRVRVRISCKCEQRTRKCWCGPRQPRDVDTEEMHATQSCIDLFCRPP